MHATQSDAVQECRMRARQIRLHNPDPYYTGHHFEQYLRAANAAVDGIFHTAGIDFGLLPCMGKPATRDSFEAAIRERGRRDALASEFLEWYDAQHSGPWHSAVYTRAVGAARRTVRTHGRAPGVRIMISASDGYADDPSYEVDTAGLTSRGRLRSRDELSVEVRRRLPAFLDMVNDKRRRSGEPAASAKDVGAFCFAVVRHGGKTHAVDMARAADVYVQALQRMISESEARIRDLAAPRP
ncbi:MAG: hypothetical protein J4F28_07890 [Nitrosopumilaceae archaeon]|nr:hypothetical protein [Nitrosopumilaceae archaeon]